MIESVKFFTTRIRGMIMIIKIDRLKKFINTLLNEMDVNEEHSEVISDIYTRATLRGVGHHDIYDLPGRLKRLDAGIINKNPNISLNKGFGSIENYDGDNGLGEVCTSFIMERAQELADSNGISFCSIYNSNHFLSAAPYVEKASELGYFSIAWTSARTVMGWPGSGAKIIGNNPMGDSTPTKETPICLDISMAYDSVGRLKDKEKKGENLPPLTALDKDGNYTEDPAEALKGSSLPIGGHKGFGLSMLGELLTTVMGNGIMIDEKAKSDLSTYGKNLFDQMVIVIKPDVFMSMDEYKDRVEVLTDFVKSKNSNLRIPGERSYETRKKHEVEGIDLDKDLINTLNEWADKYKLFYKL